jgi:hypothetical protein
MLRLTRKVVALRGCCPRLPFPDQSRDIQHKIHTQRAPFLPPSSAQVILSEREHLPPSVLATVAALPLLESVPSAQVQHHQQDISEEVEFIPHETS